MRFKFKPLSFDSGKVVLKFGCQTVSASGWAIFGKTVYSNHGFPVEIRIFVGGTGKTFTFSNSTGDFIIEDLDPAFDYKALIIPPKSSNLQLWWIDVQPQRITC